MARSTIKLPGLRKVRERNYLTQAELAEKAHVHRVTVTNLELGTPANIATARALADALQVKLDELSQTPG